MFDTTSYNASDKHLPFFERYSKRFVLIYKQLVWITGTFIRKPANKKFEFASLKMRTLKQRLLQNDDSMKTEGVSEGKRSELPKYLHKVHRANYQALENYILPEYSGKLYLFRAMDQTFYIEDPILYGWDKFVKGGVVVLDIPGEHSRIFAPPNDKIFAEALQKCLNEINSK